MSTDNHDDLGFVETPPQAAATKPEESLHDDLGFVEQPEEKGLISEAIDYIKPTKDTLPGLARGVEKGAGLPAEVASWLVSKGISPEAANEITPAALSSAFEKNVVAPIGDAITGNDTTEVYNNLSDKQMQDEYNKQISSAKEKAPIAGFVGEAASSLPTYALAGGAAGKVAQAAGSALETGKLGQLGINAATQAPAQAIVAGGQGYASDQNASEEQKQENATNAAEFGGALGMGGEAFNALITPEARNALASKLTGLRNKAAIRTLGPTAKEVTQLRPIEDKVSDALFAGEKPALTPLASKEDIRSSLQDQLNSTGKTIENSVNNINSGTKALQAAPDAPLIQESVIPSLQQPASEAETLLINKSVDPVAEQSIAAQVAKQPVTVQQEIKSILDPRAILKNVKDEVMGPIVAEGDLGNFGFKYEELANKFENLPDTSLKSLIGYRQALDKEIKSAYNTGSTTTGDNLKAFRRSLDGQLNNAALKLDKLAGTNSFNALQDAKRKYHILKNASKIVEKSAARDVTQGGGFVTNKYQLGKRYGNQIAATGLNALKNLVQTDPTKLGKFAGPLESAAKRGTLSLSATHFALYNGDPSYREVIDPLQEQFEEGLKEQNNIEEQQGK